MTRPNLYLAIRKASPCHWYGCYKQRGLHNIQKLYYSTTPVPGIYAITANRRHYLVAIRAVKGKKDTENMFEPVKNSYDDAILRSKAAKANQIITNTLSRRFSFSSSRTTLCLDDNDNKEDYVYSCSFTHPEHIKILEQDRPNHSKDYILNGTGGHAPHQKSPFRNHLVTKHDNRISPFLDLFGCQGESRLQEVDINGFKKLRQPLRIQFCAITQRWMFRSEIKTRTEIVLACKDRTCLSKSHEGCEKQVWRKMFVLDDGYSWIEVGQLGKGKDVFYRVDDETQCMTRQSKEEIRVSLWYLERENGRFLEYDEKADYMSLVRYLQRENVEGSVKKGEAYTRKIENESAEKEIEKRLEEEWAEEVMFADNSCKVKLVKTWKVEVREVSINEREVPVEIEE